MVENRIICGNCIDVTKTFPDNSIDGDYRMKKLTWSEDFINQIICGNVLDILRQIPDNCIDTIITSPPYWSLRNYGVKGQIGLEPTLEEYIERLLAITKELKRVLKPTGVCFWNHGDSYYGGGHGGWRKIEEEGGLKDPKYGIGRNFCPTKNWDFSKYQAKCMVLQNYRLILRMIDEQGWILRNVIIWNKPNHMPSSVKDRFTNAYEPVFMLVKNKKYWFDLDAVRVPHKPESIERAKKGWHGNLCKGHAMSGIKDKDIMGTCHPLGKNPGDVWTIPTQPFPEAHFATFPEKLIEPMIKAGCPQWICKKCGKARVRITKPTNEYKRFLGTWSKDTDKNPELRIKWGFRTTTKKASLTASYQTIGWTDCGCNAGWEAGIVLDPFIGSGTTALVALQLGRRFIGIDINPEYCKMARKRIEPELNQLKLL